MGLAIWFWILMVLWLVLGAGWGWVAPADRGWRWGFSALIWFLFLILGWSQFGSPVKGG